MVEYIKNILEGFSVFNLEKIKARKKDYLNINIFVLFTALINKSLHFYGLLFYFVDIDQFLIRMIIFIKLKLFYMYF